MANPPITKIDFSTGNAVVYADSARYTFPIKGQTPGGATPPPVVVDPTKAIADLKTDLDARLDAVLAAVKAIPSTGGSTGGTSPPPPPADSGHGSTDPITATVNGTTRTGTLAELIAAIPANGTLVLPAGHFNATAAIGVACTISGAGKGKTLLDATGLRPAWSKAVLVAAVPGVVITDMSLTGAAISASDGMNASGVRDGGPGIGFTLKRVEIYGCQDGTLTFDGTYVYEDCDFHDNGSAALANGQSATHEIYLNGNANSKATLTNVNSATGPGATHALKSRAGSTICKGGSYTGGYADNGAASGSVIDIAYGGVFELSDAVVTLRDGASMHVVFGYAMEGAPNGAPGAKFTNVTFVGGGHMTSGQGGTLTFSNCKWKGSPPDFNFQGWASVVGTIDPG